MSARTRLTLTMQGVSFELVVFEFTTINIASMTGFISKINLSFSRMPHKLLFR